MAGRADMEALRRLLPPPATGGDDVDWDRLAESTGWVFPQDYKEFVRVYGGGDIDDYISVSTPPVPGSFYDDLLQHVDGIDAGLVHVEPKLLLGTPPPHAVLFACSGGGDYAYWLLRGAPDEWQVLVLHARNQRCDLFEGGMVEFLVAALSGSIDCMGGFSGEETHRYTNWKEHAA
jgi:hypothetical protein